MENNWGNIKPQAGNSIDWGNTISKGLVSAFFFNEKAGTIIRDYVGQSNGAMTAGSWISGPGVNDVSALLNGSNSYINLGQSSLFKNIGQITIYSSVYPGSLKGKIADKYQSANLGWQLFEGTDGSLSFLVSYNGDASDLLVATPAAFLTASAWNDVFATWDGTVTASNVHIFNNGIEATSYPTQTSGSGVRDDDSAQSLSIGGRIGVSSAMNGNMRWFYLWNRVLTQEERIFLRYNPYALAYQPLANSVAPVTATNAIATPSIVKVSVIVKAPSTLVALSAFATTSLKTISVIIKAPSVSISRSATASPSVALTTVLLKSPSVSISASRIATTAVALVSVVVKQATGSTSATQSATATPSKALISVIIKSPSVSSGGSKTVALSTSFVSVVVKQATASVSRSSTASLALSKVTVLVKTPTTLISVSKTVAATTSLVTIKVFTPTTGTGGTGTLITVTINLASKIEKYINYGSTVEQVVNKPSRIEPYINLGSKI